MATFIRHESCPRCGSRDNLATYSDGSAWCFGCRYFKPPQIAEWTKHDNSPRLRAIHRSREMAYSGTSFPEAARTFLSKYGFTVEDCLRYGWYWDTYREQLVFPLYDRQGSLVCTQARNFNPERKSKAKYYNSGEKDLHWTIYGSGLPLVFTEDILSAAKVGRVASGMPLLGVSIGKSKLASLRPLYDRLVVWLDEDKWREARSIADQAKLLGFTASTILSEKDPKEYSVEEIQQFLGVK